MNDDPISAIARADSSTMRALHVALSAHDHRHSEGPAVRHQLETQAAELAQATDLAFRVDSTAHLIIVQVIDRGSGAIVRSFPLILPGVGPADEETPRGALVDAKA